MRFQRFLFFTLLVFSTSIFAQTTAPLIQQSDLVYQGAFRVPGAGAPENNTFDYGGTALGFYPATNSLFLVGHRYAQRTANFSIPTLINSSNINDLNTAVFLQNFVDATEGRLNQIDPTPDNGIEIGGNLVYNGRLIISAWSYYDGDGNQAYSHFNRPLNLSTTGNVVGPYKVGTSAHFTGGYMTLIPQEWQSLLGGPALTGMCCASILNYQSNGPSLTVFDPNVTTQTGIRILGYPISNPMYGDDYVKTMKPYGVVFPSGTRSILFFGYEGKGPYCYGTGAACNDPADDTQGTHAYPYRYTVWAYDANDLLAVKNGTLQPYEPLPYAIWEFNLPFETDDKHLTGGTAYDPATNRIYFSQQRGDYKSPVIHVFKVQVGGAATPEFTLSAIPAIITSGQNSTLTWSAVTNATSCTASGGTFTGSKSTSGGTQSVSPTTTTTYTLSCTGAGGTINRDATVTVTGGTNRTVEVRTLSQLYSAFSSEQANDTIVIYPDGSPYTLNSTELVINQPNITVMGSTGNRNDVIIRGDAMSSGALIKMIFAIYSDAADNITIKDLSIGRVGWHAIKFYGENNAGDGSIIDNIRVFDTYEQMIKVSDSGGASADNVTVKNSLFEYTTGVGPQYYIGGIDAHRSTGWVIQDNTFRDIQSPSSDVAEHAIHLWDDTAGTGNNTIERNTIINCDRGIGLWLNSGGIIRNNMILHDGSGAFPDVAIDVRNSQNVRVYNNTSWIAASGYYTNIELVGATSTGLVITNNLVNKGISNISAPSPTLTSNITNAQASWFVNVASDLHLASSVSSVVNQGVSVSGLTDDIDKDSRPQGSGIDIGADELTQSTNILYPPTNLRIIN